MTPAIAPTSDLARRLADLNRRCGETRERWEKLGRQIDRHLAELRRLAKRMGAK